MSNFILPKMYDADGDLSKRWFVFYSFKNPDSRKMQRFRIFISKKFLLKTQRYKKANEYIDIYTSKLISGWNPFQQNNRQHIMLVEAVDIIYKYKSNSLRPRSISSYRSVINIFKEWLVQEKLNNIYLAEFDFYKARDFMDYALNDRNIAPRTYNNYLMYMTAIFNSLIYRQYTALNPFKTIEKLPKTQAPIVAYTPDELKLIKNTLPKYDMQLFYSAMLVFYCFLRPQEIVRLKMWQIDLVRMEIVLTGNMTKNKKQNNVAIPEPLVEILNGYKLNGNPSLYVFSKDLMPGKKLIAPTRLAEKWRAYANSVKLPDWKGMYDLKHTGAGMCVDAGINLRDLQLHLRHSSLEQTQVYLEKFRNITSEKLIKDFPRF